MSLLPEDTPKHRLTITKADGTVLPGGFACPCSTVTHETLLLRQRDRIRDRAIYFCPACRRSYFRDTRGGGWGRM